LSLDDVKYILYNIKTNHHVKLEVAILLVPILGRYLKINYTNVTGSKKEEKDAIITEFLNRYSVLIPDIENNYLHGYMLKLLNTLNPLNPKV
jgi:hypothetical protein